MSRPVLAPWVVTRRDGGRTYLLGPGFNLLEIDGALDLDTLSAEDLRELQGAGYVEDAAREDDERALEPAEAPRTGAKVIVCGSWTREARLLREALAAEGDPGWVVAEVAPEPAPSLVIILEATERGYAEAPSGAPCVLWLGESTEGPHVGPRFTSPEDAAAYTEAARDSALVRGLTQRGFGARWPLDALRRLRTDARAVARAILRQLAGPAATCVLIDADRVVVPWTALAQAPADPAELLDAHCWSKGLIHDLEVRQDPVSEAFLGSCSGPCAGDGALESKFGKGFTIEEARDTTVGEAVERFSAWRAAFAEPESAPPTAARAFMLDDFHPFGASLDRYQQRGSPSLPLVRAHDQADGADVWVPACLVAEPYRSPAGSEAPTGGTTSGLAAFPSHEGAVLRGALELLERNDFYPAFLHQRPARRLTLAALPGGPSRDRVAALEDRLRRLSLSTWLLVYDHDDLRLPIVHSFLWDPEHGEMSRGAGSGIDVGTAASKALVEALQIRRQHAFVRSSPSGERAQEAYRAWGSPAVTAPLRRYLDAQPIAERALPDYASESALLTHIKERLRSKGTSLLAADLPCPVRGWSALRVLIPGATCHGIASNSRGGRRLRSPRFRHAVPI